jgi:hypothetical protein
MTVLHLCIKYLKAYLHLHYDDKGLGGKLLEEFYTYVNAWKL